MQIDVFIFYLIIRIVPHTAEMRTSQYKMSHWQQHANSAVDSVEIRFVMAKSKLYCFFSQLMINISNNDVTKKKSFASQSYCPKNVMISISVALLAHVQFWRQLERNWIVQFQYWSSGMQIFKRIICNRCKNWLPIQH